MSVDIGGDEDTMWRMPGYGDFLEAIDPGIRRRHAEFGAPEGFSDAIAWMSALAPDDDRPAHWSIKFAVDDTRATAERTIELGGSGLVEPSRQRPCESPSWPTRRERCSR